MSHSVNVSPEARAKDAAFLQERAASGKEKYIARHSKQARFTHGITVIACILLAISGLFVFVPQLAQAVGADTVFVIRMSHRVLGFIFVLVPLISAIMAPKGVPTSSRTCSRNGAATTRSGCCCSSRTCSWRSGFTCLTRTR